MASLVKMLYNANSIYYDRRDLRFLLEKPLSYADKDIEAQQKKTQEAIDELKEASNLQHLTCGFLLLQPTNLDRARKLTDTTKLRKGRPWEVQF